MSSTNNAQSPAPLSPQNHSHSHGHHHHHGGHGQDQGYNPDNALAEANRHHYDKTANEYDNTPRHQQRAERVGLAMLQSMPLNKNESSVLEFAAGTGLVARKMLPHVKEIVGIDISPGATERFNSHMKALNAGEGSYGVVADIVTDKNVLSGRKFDLVYCASAYHHFDDPALITTLLAKFVKPGGSLVIVDNMVEGDEHTEKPVDEEYRAYVTRHGFKEEEVKLLLEGAGLVFEGFAQIPDDPEDNKIFIARGVLHV